MGRCSDRVSHEPPLYQLTRTSSCLLFPLFAQFAPNGSTALAKVFATYDGTLPLGMASRQLQGQNYRILVTVADLSDIDKKQPPAFLSRRSSTPTRDELGGSFGGERPCRTC